MHGRQDTVGHHRRARDGHELRGPHGGDCHDTESVARLRYPLVRSDGSGDPGVPAIDLRPLRLDQLDEVCASSTASVPRGSKCPMVDELAGMRHLTPMWSPTPSRCIDDELAGWAWIWNPLSEATGAGV